MDYRLKRALYLSITSLLIAAIIAAVNLSIGGVSQAPAAFRADVYGQSLSLLGAVAPLGILSAILSLRNVQTAVIPWIAVQAYCLYIFSGYIVAYAGSAIFWGVLVVVVLTLYAVSFGILTLEMPRSRESLWPAGRLIPPGILGVAAVLAAIVWRGDPLRAADAGVAALLMAVGLALILIRNGWGTLLGTIGGAFSAFYGVGALGRIAYLSYKGIPVTMGEVVPALVVIVAGVLSVAAMIRFARRSPA